MNAEDCTRELLLAFREGLRQQELKAADNIFNWGANSLLVSRSLLLAAERGVQVAIADVYRHHTVQEIARHVRRQEWHRQEGRESPLSPTAQFLMEDGRYTEHYNTGELWSIDAGLVDFDRLGEAIDDVFTALPSLNMRIARRHDGLVQRTGEAQRGTLARVAIQADNPDTFSQTVERHLSRLQLSYWFEPEEPLVRAVLFTSNDWGARLFIGSHHLVLDGVAFRLLLREISRALVARERGVAYLPACCGAPASAWTERLLRYAREEAPAELTFWRQLPWDAYRALGVRPEYRPMSGEPPVRFSESSARAIHHAMDISAPYLAAALYDQCTVRLSCPAPASEVFLSWTSERQLDCMLVCTAAALHELTGASQLFIDMFHSLRGPVFDDFDASRCVSYINELVPVAIDFDSDADPQSNMAQVRHWCREVPKHGLGWRTLRYLCTESPVRQEARAWPEPRVALNFVASLQNDYPRDLLGLALAGEWQGVAVPESRMPHWLSFTACISGGRVELEVRHQPRQVNHAGAHATVKRFARTFHELCSCSESAPAFKQPIKEPT